MLWRSHQRVGLTCAASLAVGTSTGVTVAPVAAAVAVAAPVTHDAGSLAIAAAGAAASGFDYYKDFRAGSTGIVDEKDVSEVVFAGPKAKLHNSVDQGRAVIRYHLNPQFPFATSGDLFLGLRWIDNGDDARIVAKLKQMDRNDNTVSTLITLDTDDYAPDDDVKFDALPLLDIELPADAILWVEVVLIRDSADGRPEVHAVEVLGYVDT